MDIAGATAAGSCEGGSCTCSDGYVGDYCQLAPAYVITGAADAKYDGRYERLATECSGKPVYQLGGSGGSVLYQPTGGSYWRVTASAYIAITSCAFSGYIHSGGNGGSCSSNPDGGGCAGRWQEYDGSAWQAAPSLAVNVCPADDPCCGMDCGANGAAVVGGGGAGDGSCGCACSGGYVGEYCQLAPAYIISGAADDKYNGRYERLAATECNGKPVYQLGGSGGSVLFQPTDRTSWMVRNPSYYITSCADYGRITISSYSGSCPASPDGGGCAGRWREHGGSAWQDVPSLAVVPG